MVIGSQCCNSCFDFDRSGLQNVKFYVAGGRAIVVTYTKDGSVYTRISFDCGATFGEPKKILGLKGNLKALEVLAKGEQFVVATLERVGNKDLKRAVAGLIREKDNDFDFRECEKSEEHDEIINVSLGFRPREDDSTTEESVDYVFIRNPQGLTCLLCQGHG